MMRKLFAHCLMVSAILLPANGWAVPKNVEREYREIQQELKKSSSQAKKLEKREEKLADLIEHNRTRLITAGDQTQRQEADLLELEKQLADLHEQREALYTDLVAKNKNSSLIISQLMQLSDKPDVRLFALPLEPDQAIRSVAIMRRMLPALQQQAKILKEKLETLSTTEQKIALQKQTIEKKVTKLSKDQEWLNYLIEKRSKSYAKVKTKREKSLEKIAGLAAKSNNFKDLLSKLKSERKAAAIRPPQKPNRAGHQRSTTQTFASNYRGSGTMTTPVKGRILVRYGQKQETGPKAKGMTIETRPGATVTAPVDGEVVYSGKFRGYGNLIIIEHDKGYHSLLAGMNTLDSKVGQWVLAGEPIGRMGSLKNNPPKLYLELRRNGQPINMNSWLAQTNKKVSG